jgi:hypothetical protein
MPNLIACLKTNLATLSFKHWIPHEDFKKILIISFIYVDQELWTNFATEHINLLDVMFIEITFLA